MRNIINKLLDNLYRYDFYLKIKTKLRPLKQNIFGVAGIYKWTNHIKHDASNPIKTVFDVGAAVGETTLLFNREFPLSTIYAFEPQPSSRSRLVKRTISLGDKVKIFSNGFYNKSCESTLNITSYEDASSILPIAGLQNKDIKEVDKLVIKLETIDDFVRSHDIQVIDLCKIDVEGVELEVLEGGLDSFMHKVKNVIVEISNLRKGANSDNHIKVFKFMHECGFSYIGCDTDYFFTKDDGILKTYF